MKKVILFGAAILLVGTLQAQLSLGDPVRQTLSGTDAPTDTPKPKPAPKIPTEITASKEASFDAKSHQAVFVGDVVVKDAQFNLSADRLTATLRNEEADQKAESKAVEKGATSGLEKAVAEGNVIIIQEKPGEDGKEPTRYIGKGEKAEYDTVTGELKLTGWPQIQQGINNHVATEASTIMILNKDGRMKTLGRSKTVIKEKTDTKAN